MKVDIQRRLDKVVIELESKEELKYMNYLVYCDVSPENNSQREDKLQRDGIDYKGFRAFQQELWKMLKEDNC